MKKVTYNVTMHRELRIEGGYIHIYIERTTCIDATTYE